MGEVMRAAPFVNAGPRKDLPEPSFFCANRPPKFLLPDGLGHAVFRTGFTKPLFAELIETGALS